MTDTDTRREQALAWAQGVLGEDSSLGMLAGDASFRRYFRLSHAAKCYVLMDAPPGKEDVKPFLSVRAWMSDAGLRVPQLVAADESLGLLLLEDFGDVTWAVFLEQGGNVDALMPDALRQLALLQAIPQGVLADVGLPVFDVPRMQRECDLYLDWYLPYVAGENASPNERENFHAALLPLLQELSDLPRTPVHLDYHSRNLMLPDDGLPLGVIDFQDAVYGPLSYDAASLLYDCYQNYPESMRRAYSLNFYSTLGEGHRASFSGFEDWHRLLRLTAMQRHIKAIGIFSRLAKRDGKTKFLEEIPLTRRHLRDEMAALGIEGEGFSLLLREAPL
ncbi:MAG: phosphotransferase [Mariprofundaceae bacterium]|nr:phosphotransferase [Mariprofundaceae bacterium]